MRWSLRERAWPAAKITGAPFRVFEKAHGIKPDAESAVYNLALALYRSGDLARALETLQSIALQSVPATDRQPDVLYLRGKVLNELGKAGARTI